MKEGDKVEVLVHQNGCFNQGDIGVIVDLTDDVEVGENCIVDFSGNEKVYADGLWWVMLEDLNPK